MHLEACTEKTIADYNFNTFPPRDTPHPAKKKKNWWKSGCAGSFKGGFSVVSQLNWVKLTTTFQLHSFLEPGQTQVAAKTLALGLFWVTSRFWDTTLGTTWTLSNFTYPTNTLVQRNPLKRCLNVNWRDSLWTWRHKLTDQCCQIQLASIETPHTE